MATEKIFSQLQNVHIFSDTSIKVRIAMFQTESERNHNKKCAFKGSRRMIN